MCYHKPMATGQIYKIHSDFYYVDDGINKHECKIREVLKKQRNKILVGDFVDFNGNAIEKITFQDQVLQILTE